MASPLTLKWLVVVLLTPDSIAFLEYGPGRTRNGAGSLALAHAREARAKPTKLPARIGRGARRIRATLAQARPEADFPPRGSVIGFDDLRRGLDDEDLFAAVGIDLH